MSDNDDPMNIPEYLEPPTKEEVNHALAITLSLARAISNDDDLRREDLTGKEGTAKRLALVRLSRMVFQYACMAADTCPGCRALDLVSDYHGVDVDDIQYEDQSETGTSEAISRVMGEGTRALASVGVINLIKQEIDGQPVVTLGEEKEVGMNVAAAPGVSDVNDPSVQDRMIAQLANVLPQTADLDSVKIGMVGQDPRPLTEEEREKLIAVRAAVKQSEAEEIH